MKPTHRKSWAGNLLMLLDLIFVASFKVKRWITGFGELSFGWIQICIGSLMRRSSCGISIDTYTPINKIYSFVIFSLLINAVILQLKYLDLILYLYIHFLSVRGYFLYLNIIWNFILPLWPSG